MKETLSSWNNRISGFNPVRPVRPWFPKGQTRTPPQWMLPPPWGFLPPHPLAPPIPITIRRARMHGSRAWNLKNLNTRQLDFIAVHSNNKNLSTQRLYIPWTLDARQSDFTAVYGNNKKLNTWQLYSFLEYWCALKFSEPKCTAVRF